MELKDWLGPAVAFAVGFFAFVVYFLQKRAERVSAAMIITIDVRDNEQLLTTLMESGDPGRLHIAKHIRFENWEKLKHLFATILSQDEMSSFNRFFRSCSVVSDAADDYAAITLSNLQAKASVAQELVGRIELLGEEYVNEREKIKNRLNSEQYMFYPAEPLSRVGLGLNGYERLSVTTGFAVLRKIAGDGDRRFLRFF